MPEFIAFVSPKGGCGATFACAGVWQAFAKKGARVLAVDLCGRRCALDFALGFQNDSVYNVSDVTNGKCGLEEAVCCSSLGGHACFLRGDADAAVVDILKLKTVLSKTDFEYVLIDVGCDENSALIMDHADKNIIVTDCTEVSVRMCDAFASGVDWKKSYIIINKIIPSYIKNKLMPNADDIVDGIGLRPLGLVPWSPDAVMLYGCSAEKTFYDKNLCEAFDNISVRIMGDSAAAIDFNMNYDCFKIKKRR